MNHNGQEFVPLPRWDDQDDIPNHFWDVKPKDDGTPREHLNSHYNHLPPPVHPLPASVSPPQLCNFDNAEDVAHELSTWHGEVHGRLGGVMFLLTPHGPDPTTEAAAALIFWPWHAFNDEIYHDWERCKLTDSQSLTVGQNADGRVEVFAIGSLGAVWHCWQQPTYGGWSLWASLGGIAKQIVVGSNADGRLELFAIGSDDALWHIWQTAPNNGWSAWESLGGIVKQIALGRNVDGRLEVFAIGSDDALWHIWQTAPNNGWSNWESLGSPKPIRSITVGTHSGRLEAFAIDTEDDVWSTRQTSAGQGPWMGWERLAGQRFKQVVPAVHADGHLQVFGIGTDDQVWYKWRTPIGGDWSRGWRSLHGGIAKQLAVGKNEDGCLEVFVIGSDNRLWHSWELIPSASISWSGWETPNTWGASGSDRPLEAIGVGQNADGHLEVFAAVKDDVIWHIWQSPGAPGGWDRWQLL